MSALPDDRAQAEHAVWGPISGAPAPPVHVDQLAPDLPADFPEPGIRSPVLRPRRCGGTTPRRSSTAPDSGRDDSGSYWWRQFSASRRPSDFRAVQKNVDRPYGTPLAKYTLLRIGW